MHDIFEGVAVVELHCMFATLIHTDKLFNLASLNNRILNFPYGATDSKNKPLPLPSTYLTKSSTEALKQNCKFYCKHRFLLSIRIWVIIYIYIYIYMHFTFSFSNMWLLPLIIGDFIPDEHPNWKNFLRLLELVDYVCAHETTSAIAGYLRDLIRDHHICFKLLYPDQQLTPKFHHLIHIPQCKHIRNWGM